MFCSWENWMEKESLFGMQNHRLILWTMLHVLHGGGHPGNFQNKSVSSPFNWVSRYILFLAKLKGRRRPFLLLLARQRSNNYSELSKENVLVNMMLSNWHSLLESSSWYGFSKSLNYSFRSSYSVLEIYVLKAEENYLTRKLS